MKIIKFWIKCNLLILHDYGLKLGDNSINPQGKFFLVIAHAFGLWLGNIYDLDLLLQPKNLPLKMLRSSLHSF